MTLGCEPRGRPAPLALVFTIDYAPHTLDLKHTYSAAARVCLYRLVCSRVYSLSTLNLFISLFRYLIMLFMHYYLDKFLYSRFNAFNAPGHLMFLTDCSIVLILFSIKANFCSLVIILFPFFILYKYYIIKFYKNQFIFLVRAAGIYPQPHRTKRRNILKQVFETELEN